MKTTDGFAPYVKNTARESSIIFQNEHFNPETKQYRCQLTTGAASNERFKIVYDRERMYKSGIVVTIDGDAVDAQDDGMGNVAVVTMNPKTNAAVDISPK
jgi:polyisoprenoid-binding protein YceI